MSERGAGEPPAQPAARDAENEEASLLHEPSLPSARGSCGRCVPSACLWHGWVVLALCTLARMLKSYGQNNTLFLSVPGILVDVGMTRTSLGVWFSLACLLAAVVQPFFGRLHDRLGGRTCISVALLALAAGLFALAASRNPASVFVSLIVRLAPPALARRARRRATRGRTPRRWRHRRRAWR